MALISCTKSQQAPDHLRKGAWSKEEDALLRKCVESYGEGNWHSVPGRAGLKRCRKSCRLRWLNYLSPRINRGKFSEQEDDLILRLHRLLGNRWSLIAGRLPGRTANDIKNHWNTNLSKKVAASSSKADRRVVDAKIIKPRPYRAKGRWIPSTDQLQPAGLIEFEKEQTGIAKLPTIYENYDKEQNNIMVVNHEHGDCTVPEIDNSTTWDLHDAFGIRDLDDIRDDELLLEGVHAWEERLWETIFSS